MHWALGFVIGIVVCVVVYFMYVMFAQSESEVEVPQPSHLRRYLPPPNRPPPPLQPVQLRVQPPAHNVHQLVTHPPPPPQNPSYTMKDQTIGGGNGHPHGQNHSGMTNGDEIHLHPVPDKEEYNEIRVIRIASLPHTATDLKIKNAIGAELVSAVIPKGEYTVSSTENTMTFEGNDVTLDVGDYTITSLAAHIQIQIRAIGAPWTAFTVTYNTLTTTVTFSDASTTFSGTFNSQLAYMLGFASTTFTATGAGPYTVTGTNRVDIFGNRYVQVRTAELDGPDGHHKGIMQTIHVSGSLTHWENRQHPTLTRRIFHHPRNIDRLTFSIMTRHPSETGETDFKQLALTGVVASLTVSFRCVRYKHVQKEGSLHL